MKLYKSDTPDVAGDRWFGTQADAKKAVGKHNFSEVDVPTDKWGLIGWLNANTSSLPADEPSAAVAADPDPDPDCERLDDSTLLWTPGKTARAERSIAIDDEIASADFPTALRIAEHATSRVAEHLREIADARFPKPAARYTKLEDILK